MVAELRSPNLNEKQKREEEIQTGSELKIHKQDHHMQLTSYVAGELGDLALHDILVLAQHLCVST